jgi:hypothetical protein
MIVKLHNNDAINDKALNIGKYLLTVHTDPFTLGIEKKVLRKKSPSLHYCLFFQPVAHAQLWCYQRMRPPFSIWKYTLLLTK